MKTKTFFCGIAAIVFGAVMSSRPYNPGHFPTVPEFALHCNMSTAEFLQTYHGGFTEPAFCIHNTGLLLILCAILVGGGYLVYRSKFWTKLTTRR